MPDPVDVGLQEKVTVTAESPPDIPLKPIPRAEPSPEAIAGELGIIPVREAPAFTGEPTDQSPDPKPQPPEPVQVLPGLTGAAATPYQTLQKALQEDTEPVQLDRLSFSQLFLLGMAGYANPAFQQSVVGPAVAHQLALDEKEERLNQDRKDRNLEKAKVGFDAEGILAQRELDQSAEERAEAEEARRVQQEKDRVEAHRRAMEEMDEQQRILAETVEANRRQYIISKQKNLETVDAAVEAAIASGVPSAIRWAKNRQLFVQGQFADMDGFLGLASEGKIDVEDSQAQIAAMVAFAEEIDAAIEEMPGEIEDLIQKHRDFNLELGAATGAGKVPASITKELAVYDVMDIGLDKILDFQIRSPGVGGPFLQGSNTVQGVTGRIGDATGIKLFGSKEAFDEKAGLIANVETVLVRMQSGAQVTENEFKRIAPMMPSTALTDKENVGRIIRLKAFIAANREALERRFGLIQRQFPPGVTSVEEMTAEQRFDFEAKRAALESHFTKTPGFQLNMDGVEVPEGYEVEEENVPAPSGLRNIQRPTGEGLLTDEQAGAAERARKRQQAKTSLKSGFAPPVLPPEDTLTPAQVERLRAFNRQRIEQGGGQ